MKKISELLIILLLFFVITGCSETNTIKKNVDNKELLNINKEQINEVIPFELVSDFELQRFFGHFNILINSVEGFPEIITTQDLATTQMLARVYQRYNEEYFKTYSLGIVNFATCSSESGIILQKIKYENNKIVTIFDIKSGYVNVDNIFYLPFIFQIKKEDIEFLKDSSYEIDIKVNNTLHPEIGSASYDKYNEVEIETDTFKLEVVDKGDVLIEELNQTYKAGEKVVIKTDILYDAGIEAFLDNKSIGTETSVEEENKWHWEFYFTMPDHDATLFLRVYDGFNNWNEYVEKYISGDILSQGIQNEIVYNYLFNNDYNPIEDEKGYIHQYYGHYNNTFIVMMSTTNTGYYQVIGQETIDGVTFNYSDSNRLLAYNNAKFYSLQEAFTKGLLTHDDLLSIQNFNNTEINTYSLEEVMGFTPSNITKCWYSPGETCEARFLTSFMIENMIYAINVEYREITENDKYVTAEEYCLLNKDINKIIYVSWTSEDKVIIKNNNRVFISLVEVDYTTAFISINYDFIYSRVTIQLANEIKLAYLKENKEEASRITLAELDNIGIRHYHGCVNGYHIVMMDGIYSYDQAKQTVLIDGVTINYRDGNTLLAYKNGKFYTLQ